MLLLADLFEEFRGVCMRNDDLDPALYVSSPLLTWDAMIGQTNCTLDLISDPEMFSMVDDRIRDGVSMISTPHAHANNPYIPAFDAAPPRSNIARTRTEAWAYNRTELEPQP